MNKIDLSAIQLVILKEYGFDKFKYPAKDIFEFTFTKYMQDNDFKQEYDKLMEE